MAMKPVAFLVGMMLLRPSMSTREMSKMLKRFSDRSLFLVVTLYTSNVITNSNFREH